MYKNGDNPILETTASSYIGRVLYAIFLVSTIAIFLINLTRGDVSRKLAHIVNHIRTLEEQKTNYQQMFEQMFFVSIGLVIGFVLFISITLYLFGDLLVNNSSSTNSILCAVFVRIMPIVYIELMVSQIIYLNTVIFLCFHYLNTELEKIYQYQKRIIKAQ